MFDDFPVSPARTVSPDRYYAAYLRALEISEAVPLAHRGARPERALYDLVQQIYHSSENALFRANVNARVEGLSFWLSRIKSVAEWAVASGVAAEFDGISVQFAETIARTSASSAGLRSIEDLLLQKGIILVHETAVPGTKVDGCAFKLKSGHAVIGMSLRYSRLDYYYFTLIHELAHIILHENILQTPIIDDFDEPEGNDQIEIEANRLARDAIIPRNKWRTCPAKYSLEESDVIAFAEQLDIAPQLVAGRLRKEFRRHDLFSGIVHRINVREVLLPNAQIHTISKA